MSSGTIPYSPRIRGVGTKIRPFVDGQDWAVVDRGSETLSQVGKDE